jgi:hypothetical protein
MTYISIGYTVGAATVGAGLFKGNPALIVVGVCLLFVSIWEAGKS